MKNSTGTVEEIKNYYPSGALFTVPVPDVQDYKYSGKELVDYADLGWYDYGARYYDPVLMRWHSADPLLEKYYSTSPYAFCSNNFVNPDGKDIYCFSQGVYWGKSECGDTHRIANITYDSKGNTCGYHLSILKISAHINSIMNSRYNGYMPQKDSADDQKSIAAGYHYAYMNNFRKIK